MDRIFKRPFSMTGAISQDRESCQFPFLVDEKPTFVRGGSAGERSGGARNLLYPAARSNSERAAPSACVGKRFLAPPIQAFNGAASRSIFLSRTHRDIQFWQSCGKVTGKNRPFRLDIALRSDIQKHFFRLCLIGRSQWLYKFPSAL